MQAYSFNFNYTQILIDFNMTSEVIIIVQELIVK